MRRRVLAILGCLVVLAAGAPADARECLAAFHGTWRGSGTVLGREIVMEQVFRPAIGGRWTEQLMRHLASDTSTRAQFEGRGFYHAVGAMSPDSITGSWLDARGYTLALHATCVGGVLSSRWSGVENGRTIYRVVGDTLDVIDIVYPPAGEPRDFGRSRLLRR